MRKFADRVSPCRNVADMERAWGGGEDRGLSERGKWQRVCWRPVAHREDEASGRLRRDADVEWGKRARLGQCDGPRPDGLWPRRRARNGALRHFDRRLAPERRGARGRVRDGGKAVSRHALQRPRNLRAQAQPDGRADQGDGAPRLPDRPQLLRAIPARRGSGQELRRRLSPCGALFRPRCAQESCPRLGLRRRGAAAVPRFGGKDGGLLRVSALARRIAGGRGRHFL